MGKWELHYVRSIVRRNEYARHKIWWYCIGAQRVYQSAMGINYRKGTDIRNDSFARTCVINLLIPKLFPLIDQTTRTKNTLNWLGEKQEYQKSTFCSAQDVGCMPRLTLFATRTSMYVVTNFIHGIPRVNIIWAIRNSWCFIEYDLLLPSSKYLYFRLSFLLEKYCLMRSAIRDFILAWGRVG